jgi:predicted nucleic-acid-binding protein
MPMNGKHLLDTNMIVALFKDDDKVRNQIATSPEVFVQSASYAMVRSIPLTSKET